MDKNKIIGISSLTSAAMLFGLYGIFSRLLGLGFGIFYQVFSRSLIIFLILAIYLLVKRNWKRIDAKDYKWFLIMSLSGLAAAISFFVTANKLTIATNLFVFYTGSVIAGYFLGSFFFKEKLNAIKIISLLTCLIGLFMIFSCFPEKKELFYLFLALASGLGSAVWNVFSKKVSTKYPLMQVSFIDNLNFTVFSLALTIFFKDSFILPNFSLPWLNVFLFAFSTMIASLFVFNGFRCLEAQIGSLLMLSEPVFGVIFGWLFYKEVLTIYSLVGGAMILFGAALPNLNFKKKTQLGSTNLC